MIVTVQQVHGWLGTTVALVQPVVVRDPMSKLQIVRGDTFEINLQVFAQDGITPQDLTGATVRSTLKRKTDDLDTLAVSQVSSTPSSVPIGGSASLSAPTLGKINIKHAAIATKSLENACTRLVYDVQVTLSDGRVWTVDWGTIVVVPDVTLTAP